MKFRPLLSFFFALLLPGAALGYDITNGVEFLDNPISQPDDTPIAKGEFTLRLGYFNFSPERSANNAAIIANQDNQAALEANFVQLFNLDPAEQTEGDTGAASTASVRNPNGEAGPNAGLPLGTAYSYLLTTDAVWNAPPYADFRGRQIYAWVQLVSDPRQQAIFTSSVEFVFNRGNDPFDNATQFVISEFNPDVLVLVGNDRTATAANDYQLTMGAQPGQIQLSAATYAVSEGGGSVAITVQRINGSDGAVSATFSTSDGSALAGQDYTAVNQTVTFAAGSSADQVVMVPITDDTTFEGDETFQVALSAPTGGATLGAPAAATVTIQENDSAPPAGTVSFTAATYSGAEDGGAITISAMRSSGTNGPITVQYSTSDGSARAGIEYVASTGALSWADGEGGPKSFTVPVIDNMADEPDKTFTVTLSNATGGATLIAPSTATVTIVDDDIVGTISFTAASASAAENSGAIAVTVQRTSGSDGAVSVTFSTSESAPVSAQTGTDYTPVMQTVSFGNGDAAPRTITIPLVDDNIFEGNETFRGVLANPMGGVALGSPAEITLTIVDDEIARPGAFSFSAANYVASETSPSATITVTRDNGSDGEASVNYSATSGTATSGSDFAPANGTLTFASGQTTTTFQVMLIDDTAIEPDETVNLALSSPTNGATLGAIPSATLTITSEDQPAPIDQPDGLVAPRGAVFVGNNVYNTTGDGQIATRNGNGNSLIAFVVRVQNDGTATDSFRVQAVGSGTAQNASVRYSRGGIDITGQITQAAGFTIAALPSGAASDIEVEVSFNGSARFTGYGATITITSQRSSGKSDVVRALGIVNADGQPSTASLGNISTRLAVQTADRVLIGGFIITGEQPKKVIVRGVGPSLSNAGVSGFLADPTIEILSSAGAVLRQNDNWGESGDRDAIIATGIAPAHAREPAILLTLAPGAYTTILRGKNETTGVALVEVYDLDQNATSKLANISTRGHVATQDNVMIGGFIVTGGNDGSGDARVIIRAVGPTLGGAGVSDPLQDTTLEVRDRQGALVAANNNWRETQEAEIQASGLQPRDDREAAIMLTVTPGPYTAIVRGANGATGIALVEVYRIQ